MKIIERKDIQIEVNKSQINQINKGTLYIHTNYPLSRFFKMDGYKSSETSIYRDTLVTADKSENTKIFFYCIKGIITIINRFAETRKT